MMIAGKIKQKPSQITRCIFAASPFSEIQGDPVETGIINSLVKLEDNR